MRTPRDRCGFAWLPRDPVTKRTLPVDPLRRFAEKCEFDATTGCVLWRGGTTRGRGNSATYGSFWAEGRRWFAHRWAAIHIHGLDLGDDTVGHRCNRTLCVQHLERQTISANVAERNTRVASIARQSNEQKQFWLLVERGYEPEPPQAESDPEAIPFHEPPDWLRPFLPQPAPVTVPF